MAAVDTTFSPRVLRYAANGLIAAAVHFAVLYLNMEWLGFGSAGLANGCAAVAGITSSFFGNRYFVFPRRSHAPWRREALKFASLYAFAGLLHGAILFAWTDVFGLDYRVGFLLATAVQTVLAYAGNIWWVFPEQRR